MTLGEILRVYGAGLMRGLGTTLQLSLLIWTTGLVLGGGLGALGARYPRTVGNVSRAISFLLSGIPVLVLLFWLHYPTQALFNVVVNPFLTAVVALSFLNVFLVSDIIRDALARLPRQYVDAARVCGLPDALTTRRIVLPMILRHVTPALLFTQVTMLHMTLFASLISVDEVFRVAQRINAVIYRPTEVYTALAMLFLLLSAPLNGLALHLQRRYGREWSER